ncbi:ISL3 family transposase [Streptomyces canus]|uniref:ISL3 family transposase n=1 Tax=Streptomyces canus TaxID=58343 RepID=UPI0038704A65|nr:ISL3 family transposase [Streptomyces canus]
MIGSTGLWRRLVGGVILVVCAIRLEDLSPQLAAVRVDRVEASSNLLRIAARTRDDAAAVCPGCGTESDWVHSRYVRHVADEAVGGRAVVDLSVRRLYCENSDCPKTTFAEQVTGLTVRYQRRTPALQHVVNAVAVALAGSAGARLLAVLHCALSWATVLNCLMCIPVPSAAVPRVLGIDEFALRRGHRYATIIIDAATGARIDVIADRAKEPVATWLRKHAGFEVVCRDGAGSFAQAITDAAPHVVQVADRWHLWHLLGEAAHREVLAHSACWTPLGPPIREGRRAQTTRERWQQVHDLRDQGVGLLECARRLNLALNTVKRCARHTEPDRLIRTPQYRPTLVDPYREYLRKRRATEPAVPVTHLLAARARPPASSLSERGQGCGAEPHCCSRVGVRCLLRRPCGLRAGAGRRQERRRAVRHTCATLLLEQGVQLVTIKELLGHASIDITAQVYAHVRLRLQHDAINQLGDVLQDGDDPEDPPMATVPAH